MKCLALFPLIISFNLFSMHDAHKSEKSTATSKKELEKINSKNALFKQLKREKKVSIDEGDREIHSLDEIIALIKSNNLIKLKSVLSDNNELILLMNDKGENIVFYMASNNSSKALKVALNAVKPDLALHAINKRNMADMGALHVAAQYGARESALLMLEKGAAVDLPGPAMVTAYIMALNKEDQEMVSILASYGAAVKATPIGEGQHLVKDIKSLSSGCKECLMANMSTTEEKLPANFLVTYAKEVEKLKINIVEAHKNETLARNLNEYLNEEIEPRVGMVDEIMDELLGETKDN